MHIMLGQAAALLRTLRCSCLVDVAAREIKLSVERTRPVEHDRLFGGEDLMHAIDALQVRHQLVWECRSTARLSCTSLSLVVFAITEHDGVSTLKLGLLVLLDALRLDHERVHGLACLGVQEIWRLGFWRPTGSNGLISARFTKPDWIRQGSHRFIFTSTFIFTFFHFPAKKSVHMGEVGSDPRAGYFFQRSSVPPRSPLHYQLENGGL